MRRLLLALALLCSVALAQTPVAPISSIALNQYGQPIPYAQITVCPVTSTGIPCTPVANLYQDYGLTIPLANPFSADQFGNFLAYVPALAYPNLYVIQINVGGGQYWTYVVQGPASGGGGSTSPSEPLYSVQTNYPDGHFGNGLGDFLDLAPILGPLTFTGDGIDAESTDAGTDTNGGEYVFRTTESNPSAADCPACFTVVTADNDPSGTDSGGGSIRMSAYSVGNFVGQGGAVQIAAASPSQVGELTGGSAGMVQISSATDGQTDGLGYAQVELSADPFDALAGLDANLANILLQTCNSGQPVGGLSCNVVITANGGSASGAATDTGDIIFRANSSGNSGSGAILLQTYPAAGPVDATEGAITLQGAQVNITPSVAPFGGGADLQVTPIGSEPAMQANGPVIISSLTPGTNPVCPNGTNGALVNDGSCAGGSSFTAAGDLSGTNTTQEVTGILSNVLPSIAPGALNWNGSAWQFSAIPTVPITSIENGGTPITPSSGAVNFAAGTNVTLTTVGNTTTITSSATAATAFSALTTATNTTAAMTVGTGASLGASGSGTITATAMPAAGLTGTTLPSGIVTSSLTSAAGGSFGTAAYAASSSFDAAGAAAARAAVAACTSGQYASATLTSGVTCGQVQFSQIGGTPSTTQVPMQSLTTTGSGAATLSAGVLNIPTPSSAFITSLTTTGTSGNAAVSSGVLNVPNYTYTLPTATSSVLGGVKPDGTSVLNTAGAISVTPTSIGLSNVTNFTQTKAAIMPNTSPAAGQIPAGNAGGTAYAPVTMSGDCTFTSTGAITCLDSNGVAFGTGAFAAAPTITSIHSDSTLITPSAGDIKFAAGTNVTLTPSAGTITITATSTAATAFSALTGSTNTTAAMVVGTGASLAASGSGTIAATSATTATSFSGSLAGDVTGTQSATSVAKVNGGSLPASAPVVGTNGAGQIVVGPSSLPPNGTAGGDLSGTYPNPTVAKVNGLAVPTSQAVVGTNGSGQFIAGPSSLPPSGTAGGDLTGSYPNPVVTKINSGLVPTSAPLLGTNSSAAPISVTTLPTSAEPAHTGDSTNTAGSLAMTVSKLENITLPTLAASTGLFYDTAGVLSLQSTLPTAAVPAFTGDATNTAGSLAMTVKKINGTTVSGLATGILKNTTGTGVPSIAVAGTDYVTPTGSGATLTGITPSQVGTVTEVGHGTITLPTSSISVGSCALATATVTGALSTDVVQLSGNADTSGVTGYDPTAAQVQIGIPYTSSGSVNVKVCNPSSNSLPITPGTVILNYIVTRG